ncbi:hypothetical protein LTR62_004321 [Meristemomyces frigidus]|uniref:TPR-like protein n=1 Tax=Meristemomyces frigidus TaxID=1508187 RepID=A0AAN7TF76_9PEZI|nr:hypothetical protein LTR62_004321 [Meristemomyces frigidus]
MADAILTWFRSSLPAELTEVVEPFISQLEQGHYQSLLDSEEAEALFGHVDDAKTKDIRLEDFPNWSDCIFHRLGILHADRSKQGKQYIYFCIGYAALLAFLQASVTGPPLLFQPATVLFSRDVTAAGKPSVEDQRQKLRANFSIDGIAAYKLTPNIELLALADVVFTCPPVLKYVPVARWAKMRVAFLQQRLLSEVSSTLQEIIYDDLGMIADVILGDEEHAAMESQMEVEFLLERATVHLHHGLEKFAREDLNHAKRIRRFEYALTGLLGKRTKFQQHDISQLVVLAKSADDDAVEGSNGLVAKDTSKTAEETKPAEVDLNDDTLLERISFTDTSAEKSELIDEQSLSPALQQLDAGNQPQLNPLDSTLLLSFASSITNTSPQDGLTREETLPYATRVLDGGSSNWQIYTQALLVRSRIEGYKSRTVERGLLQLQALVDQVIADTAGAEPVTDDNPTDSTSSTSFLPRPKASESASVTERLRYIFQLASPSRWELEAELATRWVSLGGLRSALEIYERLEMWAEAALCFAATEQETKARNMVRRQLYHATSGSDRAAVEGEQWEGAERLPMPADAPRLYCILGDLDHSVDMYEKAWGVSHQRYARAQRSLGRHYMTEKNPLKAAEAYAKSLKANQLHHPSWFALGCAYLELAQFPKAVEAFSRCVQLDDNDAEGWSNLGAALLRCEPDEHEAVEAPAPLSDEDDISNVHDLKSRQRKNRQDALKALKRAATLKHDSYRIWDNVLTVAASVVPPDYISVLAAQKRIIDLRGSTEGEKCIDKQVIVLLAQHIISTTENYDPAEPGLARMFVKFVDESVVPLITSSAELWQLIARLALWRNRPGSALEAEEKAWRVAVAQPGWETDNEALWNNVVDATERLCDSYESLGLRERTEGMGAGELVAKDWRFKARTAVRNVMGRGKGTWEGGSGWERLVEKMQGLKG